jgi:regulator of sirC expression with transglutaminase-like and TPR domain
MMALRHCGENARVPIASFAELAAVPDPPLDELALALAAEFREVDAGAALARLDELGDEVGAGAVAGRDGLAALTAVLGRRHGFAGERERYDDPGNSMLDVVLERRAGLPILLSVLYVEVGRRAGLMLAGVGLPGHYVVGRFAPPPPVLLDPFAGGTRLDVEDFDVEDVRPWGAHETALRMLNNLVGSFTRRQDLGRAIRAAELRLLLPVDDTAAAELGVELRALRARLN